MLVNQSFKYVINVYKGITAERMLRRLRFDLYSRVLRFPLPTFRKVSQGEIIPMITAEVEPLGGFVGDAFALPVFQGGTLLVILTFLFVQNWVMAAAAVALYPIQIYVIPKLQRRINKLAKTRVKMVRKLAARIGESVQGVEEIHAHDTSNLEMADISQRLGDIFHVRYSIYRKKFAVKFLNNFIQHLGPFFFYSLGGYLAISGSLDIGTLIAAIAAHKDLAAPWKELLAYYQQKEDARIKYDQVITQFQPANMRGAEFQIEEPEGPLSIGGPMVAGNLSYKDDQEILALANLTLTLDTSDRVAVVGEGGSGKGEFMMLLARLLDPTSGKLMVNDKDMAELHEAVTGRRMSYVGPSAHIFSGSIGENLFYGLKHRPLQPAEGRGAHEESLRDREIMESHASGNLDYDVNADWLDYAAAGADDYAGLVKEGLKVLDKVDMEDEVFQFGLRGAIGPSKRPHLAEAVLGARQRLRERLDEPEIKPLVELFDREKYNSNATLAENLLFGTPCGDDFDIDRLAENAYVREVLEQVGLTDTLLLLGYQVAETMVELFADLPPDHEFFAQFSFISADDLPVYQALLAQTDADNLDGLDEGNRLRLLSMPFKVIPARHRLGVIDDEVQARVLKARAVFADGLPEDARGSVEFFDPETYNAATSLQDNILFGKIAFGHAGGAERVGNLIAEVIEELGLHDTIAEVGLDFDVGIGGSYLSSSQRQRLAIARALLKQPDLFILSEATAALDARTNDLIGNNVLEDFADAGRGLIWAVHRPDLAEKFDRVVVLKEGQIVEAGSFAELNREGTYLHNLLGNV